MSVAVFEETSKLRKKIANEKDLRQKITITQNSLMHDLNEISASASGKPGASKRVRKVNPGPGDIKSSSSGRVLSVASHGMEEVTGS